MLQSALQASEFPALSSLFSVSILQIFWSSLQFTDVFHHQFKPAVEPASNSPFISTFLFSSLYFIWVVSIFLKIFMVDV